MAVLEILEDGHPALCATCKKIRQVTDEIRKLADDMAETMFEYAGIGLAANQVGEEVRMIVVYDEDEGHKVYINPKIVRRSKDVEYSDEGCLSYPRLIGTVGRCMEIVIVAQDMDMKKVKVFATGLLARVFQHETDHLNGINFTDRAEEGTMRRLLSEEEIAELERKREEREAARDTDTAAGSSMEEKEATGDVKETGAEQVPDGPADEKAEISN